MPADQTLLKQLTGIRQMKHLRFLGIDAMIRETSGAFTIFAQGHAVTYALASSKQAQAPIEDVAVLDIDQAVLIAINSDEETIHLDYRTSRDDPRVMASTWVGNSVVWSVAAASFSSFVAQLGL
ncbi:MAG: hypothetical protein KA765_13660 [Thermoflexales bacterium]|nr:hypothetical protein [Thermoflexales bacterium]